MTKKFQNKIKKKVTIIHKRTVRKEIKKRTHQLFSATTDCLLFCLFVPLAAGGKRRTARGVDQTFEEAFGLLQGINYQTIKRALYHLKNKGLIKNAKDWALEPIITAEGKKRLESYLPVYDEKRIWDGRLFLVNYDIEITKNRLRDLFRGTLRQIGAIKLQNSLYLTFYNPHKVLQDFLDEHDLHGTALVSELGKDGFIGQGELKEFLWEQAGLEKLNQHYEEFIEQYKNQKHFSKTQVALDYYSVLRDDPQLPFQLLKDEYLGDQAYLVFHQLTS